MNNEQSAQHTGNSTEVYKSKHYTIQKNDVSGTLISTSRLKYKDGWGQFLDLTKEEWDELVGLINKIQSASPSQVSGDKELCDIASKISLDAALSQVSAEAKEEEGERNGEWVEDNNAFIPSALKGKVKILKKFNHATYSWSSRIEAITPKEEKDDWISVLYDVDFELSLLEDYIHGADGKRITAMRAKIAKVLPAPPKEAEQKL